MAAPSPVVPAGSYGPTWTNQTAQAVNGINGYAVQSAPFPMSGHPMTMQVMATSGGVGFTYTAKQGFGLEQCLPLLSPPSSAAGDPVRAVSSSMDPTRPPTQISALQTVTSSWSFTMGSSGDAVYDRLVWQPSKAPTTKPAVELMIWMATSGKQPLGTMTGGSVTGSDGVARTVHYGQANTERGNRSSAMCRRQGSTQRNQFRLAAILQGRGEPRITAGLTTSSYLLGVQTGFEVYSADTWKTTDYNITIK